MQISGSAKHQGCCTTGSSREKQCCGGSGCGCADREFAGSSESGNTAPVLVLALGNPLMSDDGAGQELLALLAPRASEWGAKVELLDGGTQGLALTGVLDGREAVIFLDAVRLGERPGAVHILNRDELMGMGKRRPTTAHEGGAPEILRAMELLGEAPREVRMIGIEPEALGLGMGLSESVRGGLAEASRLAEIAVREIVARC